MTNLELTEVPIVYPVGILLMGQELKIEPPRRQTAAATLAADQLGELPWIVSQVEAHHRVLPFAYNVVRFASANAVVPFVMAKNSHVRVDSIHAFGPALIQQIFHNTDILYAKSAAEDGKLFYCPHRVIESNHSLIIELRCLPELFMLDGRKVEQPEDDLPETERATHRHDSSQCIECAEFRKRTGLES